jgi:hypothetical protein
MWRIYSNLDHHGAAKGKILEIFFQHCIGLNIPEPLVSLDLLLAVEIS